MADMPEDYSDLFEEEGKLFNVLPSSLYQLIKLIKVLCTPKSTIDINDAAPVNGEAVATALTQILTPTKTSLSGAYDSVGAAVIDVTAFVYHIDDQDVVDPLNAALDVNFIPSDSNWDDFINSTSVGGYKNCQIFPKYAGVKYTLKAMPGKIEGSASSGWSVTTTDYKRKETACLDTLYEHTPVYDSSDGEDGGGQGVYYSFTNLYRKATLFYDSSRGRYFLFISRLRRSYITGEQFDGEYTFSSGTSSEANKIAVGVAATSDEDEKIRIGELYLYKWPYNLVRPSSN